jgi:putative acetyltransferase
MAEMRDELPDPPPDRDTERIDEVLAASAALREAGRLGEVRESLLALRTEAPGNPQVVLECAWIHDVMGLERDAADLYREAIDLGLEGEPLREALLGLGSTLRVLEDVQESLRVLRRGAALYPEAREFSPFLALTLYAAGECREAVGLLARDLAETSADPDISRYRAALSEYAEGLLTSAPSQIPGRVRIRSEHPADVAAVRAVNDLAFGQSTEGEIVDRLRVACPERLSFVAEDEDIVGHILFTPATVSSPEGPVTGMGLAPMAVVPERQRQGIGSALVEHGLEFLRSRGCPFVIVLGHPEFYPRFGFERASRYGLRCQWEGVPDQAFMVLVLDRGAMAGIEGVARYREEFDEVV